MKKIFYIFLIICSSLYAQKTVTVSILPQKYFVEKIAKDKVKINVMVQPGFSPATYEPKTSQMKELINSDIYFSIGVPFEESWLSKFTDINKNMLLVDTAKGIKKNKMLGHHHHGEAEHEEHHHDEESLDPHIWLDPILVKTQAKNILDALVKVDTTNREFYYNNYKNFLIELDNLNTKLSNTLREIKGKKFMVFHPSWGYFAKRYELEQEAVEKEGKDPKPKEMIALIEEAKEEGIKVLFVAPQFSKVAATTIAENIGGRVIEIDPLSYKWEESLVDVSEKLVNTYKQ
ncbi:zinc ABC transporter substrate-binding protein [Arcobacter sp. KX21116]|jgi:zinc transport system substrate-binding protein|uniref:metal ABC transporter solute-binding protein, Zn/Mn family n=1 Tax=Arcobacter iocasae TaxID=2906515 RepID=UPI0035D4E41C